jgi:hypothetical protein
LKRTPLRVFHAQKERQALRISQQFNAALAACTALICGSVAAAERCHEVASFGLLNTIHSGIDLLAKDRQWLSRLTHYWQCIACRSVIWITFSL